MTKTKHFIFIGLMALIVLSSIVIIILEANEYYLTSLEERFYHELHNKFKPSGIYGHGFGIIGSLFMLIGVGSYMLRKRLRSWSKIGQIKYWLEFHIFLCTLGPILVLFHTAMKFGGIVSISFWSMVAVFASGIIGRFIYVQIPRTIEGRELSLNELQNSKSNITDILNDQFSLNQKTIDLIEHATDAHTFITGGSSLGRFIKKYQVDNKNIKKIKKELSQYQLSKTQVKQVLKSIKNEIIINRRIDRLNFMKNLFKYWHVAHLPFAIIMLVIMIVHIVVTLLFGYKWIF